MATPTWDELSQDNIETASPTWDELSQDIAPPEKEETFGRGWSEGKGLVANAGDLLAAYTGYSPSFSIGDEHWGTGIHLAEDKYGEDFKDLSFDERRQRINEFDAAETERLYPNQAPSTLGGIVGTIDITTLLPVGQTYKAMTVIGGAYGAAFSSTDQLMEKGEIDPLELGAFTVGSAILAPALGYTFTKSGQAWTKARLPKKIASANSALGDLDSNISHYVALGMSPDDALAAAAKDLKLTPKNITDASKLANREPNIPKIEDAVQMASKHKEATKLSQLIESVSSRSRELSEPVFNVLRKLEMNILSSTQSRKDKVTPLVKAINAYDNKTQDKISSLLLNGRYDAVHDLLTKGGRAELEVVKNFMFADGQTFKKMYGKGFNTRNNYFPRKVNDYEGLLKAIGRQSPKEASGLKNKIDEAMKKENVEHMSQLSDLAMTKAVMDASRAAYPKVYGTSPLGKRTIKEVPDELAQFYEPATKSLMGYIESSSRIIEKHKVLGKALGRQPKDEAGDKTAELWKTIGREVKAGRLTLAAEAELKELIRARFIKGEEAMSSIYSTVKDIGYMSTLGQFRSALTQLKDVGTSAYLHGIIPTIKALFKYKSTRVHDAGLIDTISAEMLSPIATKKWLDRVLKYSGFRFSDRFGKKVLIEASMLSGKRLASSTKGVAKLKKKYGKAYGSDFEKLVTSLKNNTDDEFTELYRFHELSDTQPISMLEMPQKFLNHPDGRIFYALKSFGLKQLTLIHNNIIKRAKGGDKIGATKEALKYAAFIGIVGGTVDEVKGVFGGEDFNAEDIPDHVVNNLTGLIFLNKYSLGDLKKGDLSGFFGDLVFPPIPPLEAGIREVSGIQEERKIGDPEFGDDLIKTMPIMGRILYDWVMGGKEKAAADREKEIMAQYD